MAKVTSWCDEQTPITPPFVVFTYGNYPGNYNTILDSLGRHMIHDYHAAKFVKELCMVMNENADRLKKAWKEDVEDEHARHKKVSGRSKTRQ